MPGAKAAEEPYLVVIGASAGGIEALERLATALPADFAASIVIAQHADPKVPSRLAQILARRTSLRIVRMEDQDAELEPGTIYLAPAGKNLEIRGTRVFGTARPNEHPIPSIDALFTSAAESHGDRVVAVILTGMGKDGVAGVRAVKERGGTVLVQEPESAAFPALPAAIPLSHIDYTATLDSLAPLLATLASSPRNAEITNPDVLRAFLNQLRSRTGIDFGQYKTPTVVRRLSRLMLTSGCDTLSDYLRHLVTHPEAYQRLIGAFLIKVTEFFRDAALFDTLRETVLPDIIDNARKNGAELRLWSAGCATGEEAYSLAIALAEILGGEIERMPIRIFATDLDSDAIAFARRAIYPPSALAEMPREMLAKYFTPVEDSFQVKKQIRKLTVFGQYDIGQRAPFPRIDLVLCRNVLIYFTKELQQRTLQLFAFSLRVGGYLVLGKAETTNPLPQYFSPVASALRIFRRQGERLLIPAPATLGRGGPERPLRRVALGAGSAPRPPADSPPPKWSLVDRLGAFLFESEIGVVVVDRNYDISTINQAARSQLGIHGQGIGEDLVHLAEVPSAELKAALDAAFRNEMPGAGREIHVHDLATDQTRFLRISCFPDRTVSKDGRIEGVFVLVTDVTEAKTAIQRLDSDNEQNRAIVQRLTAQNAELMERQRSLVAANNELTSANAELRSTNEHLLISAEEAEAAAEEVETLNEELQASGEELETLNEELQSTVEELNTTNEELTARGNELERLGREREEQLKAVRFALETLTVIVDHTPLAMCLIDSDGKVAAASQRYLRLAEQNGKKLAGMGEPWSDPPKTVELHDPEKGSLRYAVDPIPLPREVTSMMVLFRPV